MIMTAFVGVKYKEHGLLRYFLDDGIVGVGMRLINLIIAGSVRADHNAMPRLQSVLAANIFTIFD